LRIIGIYLLTSFDNLLEFGDRFLIHMAVDAEEWPLLWLYGTLIRSTSSHEDPPLLFAALHHGQTQLFSRGHQPDKSNSGKYAVKGHAKETPRPRFQVRFLLGFEEIYADFWRS